MALRMLSTEDKLEVVKRIIRLRGVDDRYAPALKEIAKDLQARLESPRSNALGQLERALARMQETKTEIGYDRVMMSEVAKVVVNKWPTIRQALEAFGEESAE